MEMMEMKRTIYLHCQSPSINFSALFYNIVKINTIHPIGYSALRDFNKYVLGDKFT